ncbi:hypothetical protein GCM10010124_40100 [Pilimelia terevasa]|uniref:HTH hxlR-type domain-containing protein n=1 Tax=Pilimelia terevasa TaxID=53372 RepID=A0A8J3BTY2_9ACTN|nr:winged helix-turn-helix transcriptional regulator [Pilimelia terevasa]GGK43303.1 hypothetical protein GCM10010124_40100 [Pilimelia terevasa]
MGALTYQTLDMLRPIYRRKWSRSILNTLADGPKRYTDLSTQLTFESGELVHSQTLTDTLRMLTDLGFITHRDSDQASVYALTADGARLTKILTQLDDLVASDNDRRAAAKRSPPKTPT